MASEKLQHRIDAYLAELGRCLGELPPQEVHETLQEIRGHILERAEASGELTEDRLVEILKALGRPDEIAPMYHADAVVARARSSFSPRVVMRGIHRWSMASAWGFALFVIGVIGYATGASFQLVELFERDSKLPQDLEEERRSDLPPSVDWDGHSAAILMIPAFVTSCRSCLVESEASGDGLELARRRA